MKIFISFCLFLSVLFGDNLSFEHNYKDALQKATQEKKDVIMIYSASWCPECSYMKDVAFKEAKLNSYLKENFVLLVLDIDKGNLPKGFEYVGIPTFFVLDKDANKLGKIVGGDKPAKFLERLKEIK